MFNAKEDDKIKHKWQLKWNITQRDFGDGGKNVNSKKNKLKGAKKIIYLQYFLNKLMYRQNLPIIVTNIYIEI